MEIKPCHYGLVFALGAESGAIEDLLAGSVRIRGSGFFIIEGGIKGRRTVIIRSGAGSENAARATELLIDGHRPKIVISAGFAGGLCPTLKRHDILLANCVQDGTGGQIILDHSAISSDIQSEEQPLNWPLIDNPLNYSQLKQSNLHIGKLLTLDRVIREPAEKKSLNQQHQALAVDMETFSVAEVCLRRKIPLCAIRIINDTADDLLPRDVEHLLRQKTETARLGAALGAIWRRPASIKDFWALKENSLVDSKILADFIVKLATIP
jgi:adenosylhomocysteine nucleosidase